MDEQHKIECQSNGFEEVIDFSVILQELVGEGQLCLVQVLVKSCDGSIPEQGGKVHELHVVQHFLFVHKVNTNVEDWNSAEYVEEEPSFQVLERYGLDVLDPLGLSKKFIFVFGSHAFVSYFDDLIFNLCDECQYYVDQLDNFYDQLVNNSAFKHPHSEGDVERAHEQCDR